MSHMGRRVAVCPHALTRLTLIFSLLSLGCFCSGPVGPTPATETELPLEINEANTLIDVVPIEAPSTETDKDGGPPARYPSTGSVASSTYSSSMAEDPCDNGKFSVHIYIYLCHAEQEKQILLQ